MTAPHAELFGRMTRGALIEGAYRYRLVRQWSGGERDRRMLCWLMLNPSTADGSVDDPTIRRCCSFAMLWGYDGIIVVNLFAYRATDPAALWRASAGGIDTIGGPTTDLVIEGAVRSSATTIYGWGAHGRLCQYRAHDVDSAIRVCHGVEPLCLGLTKGGHPRHPLYVASNTAPVAYAGVP